MIFSMNGWRKSFHIEVCNLKQITEQIINDENFEKRDLVNAVNDMISASNVLNCVSSKEDPDFSDMSDLEIEHIA